MKRPLQLRPARLAAITAIAIYLVAVSPVAEPGTQDLAVSLVLGTPSAPIMLRDYLVGSRGVVSGPYTASNLARQPGRVVPFRISSLTTTAEIPCQLRWTQLDRLRQRPAEESNWRYEEVLGWPDGLLVPSGNVVSEVTGEVWVPLPNPLLDVGQFMIRFRLSCGGREVAMAETESFRVDLNHVVARTPADATVSPAAALDAGSRGATLTPDTATPSVGNLDVAAPAS